MGIVLGAWVMIGLYGSGGPAIYFNTKEACQAVLEWRGDRFWRCFPTGAP